MVWFIVIEGQNMSSNFWQVCVLNFFASFSIHLFRGRLDQLSAGHPSVFSPKLNVRQRR